MQKAETIRMNDAAATSCMEKLLADFAPCQLMPLLLRAAAESHTPEIQVHILNIYALMCRPLPCHMDPC